MGETYFFRQKSKNSYTVMSNAHLRDSRLSWQSIGLFSYILSLPDDWKIYQKELMQHATNGETSFKTALAELKQYGYIKMTKIREGGHFAYCYEIIENPQVMDVEESKPVKKDKVKKLPLLEREPENDIEKVEKQYLLNYKKLFEKGIVKTEKPVINWIQSRTMTKKCIEQYGVEKIIQSVNKSLDNDFVMKGGYSLTLILSAGVLSGLINGCDKQTGFKTGKGIDEYNGDIPF